MFGICGLSVCRSVPWSSQITYKKWFSEISRAPQILIILFTSFTKILAAKLLYVFHISEYTISGIPILIV